MNVAIIPPSREEDNDGETDYFTCNEEDDGLDSLSPADLAGDDSSDVKTLLYRLLKAVDKNKEEDTAKNLAFLCMTLGDSDTKAAKDGHMTAAGLRLVLKAMRRFPGSVDVQHQGTSLLCCLTHVKELRPILLSDDGFDAVQEPCMRFNDFSELTNYCHSIHPACKTYSKKKKKETLNKMMRKKRRISPP